MGTSSFKAQNFDMAAQKYLKAARYLDAIHPDPLDLTILDEAQKKEYFTLKVSCLLNAAMVCFVLIML
jgi:peptidyl-prolyl isomerase D